MYILLGCSADWWSVGVILFELIVGIPPFNAEHPQVLYVMLSENCLQLVYQSSCNFYMVINHDNKLSV